MLGNISQISIQLPKKRYSINKLCKKHKWNFNKILEKTGIKFVYRSNKSETALNLAISASKKLNLKRKKIGALIYVTQSPEYHLPTNACVIQDKLKLDKKIIAFDVNQGCSGYLYGLYMSKLLLNDSSIKEVLLVCSDTYTKNIKNNNKSCMTIFSDGATASIINKSKRKKLNFTFLTDGSGSNDLKLLNSGNEFKENLKPELYMNGSKILSFTMANIPNLVRTTLKKENCSINKIKYFIFHQASKVVIDNLCRILNIPEEKIYRNYARYGNTVSSTIPICLVDLKKKNLVKRHDKILLCGFGVGLSASTTIMEV